MRLIDADALHEALKTKQKWVVRCGDKHNEGYTYDQVHFAIDDAPPFEAVSIDDYRSMANTCYKLQKALETAMFADRPQGEWELVPYKRIDEHGEVIIDGSSWCCSNCGDARKRNGPDMNFCPNCGARMKGVSHDSTCTTDI